MHSDRALAEQAFLNGADGFIPKEAPADELHTAIATVLHGRRYLSPRVPRRHGNRSGSISSSGLSRATVSFGGSGRDVVTMESSGTPVRLLGTLQDVTEQRSLEAQFRQAQKLEAVGRHAQGGSTSGAPESAAPSAPALRA